MCLYVEERERATEIKADSRLSTSAVVFMKLRSEKRAGIIGDNHGFILSLPITLDRELRDEDSRPCIPMSIRLTSHPLAV